MTKSVFTDAYKTLIEVLVAARKDAGLQQEDLAQRMSWDQPTISNVERRVRRLDVVEFIAIAHAIGADPNELFAKVTERLPDKIEV
jgi:transcriptional regulator with XRE-family HTH domain